MTRLLRWASAVLLVGLFAACDSSNPLPTFEEGPLPSFFEADRNWGYSYTFVRRLPDGRVDTSFARAISVRVSDMNATVGDRTGLVEVESFTLSEPDNIGRTWYAQTADSLVEVAYQNAGATPTVDLLRSGNAFALAQSTSALLPSRIVQRRLRQAERHAAAPARTPLRSPHQDPSSQEADTIQVREDPRVVLRAPLSAGQTWVSFREPFLSERSVGDRLVVSTRAGSFATVVVDTRLPELTSSLLIRDYVSEAGLILRTITDTVTVRSPEGEPIGTGTVREEFTLSGFSDGS